MMGYRVARRSAVWLCLVLFAITVYAQAQTPGAEYTPTQGQLGKDVVWVPTAQGLVEKMLDLASVAPQDYLIDLGSGTVAWSSRPHSAAPARSALSTIPIWLNCQSGMPPRPASRNGHNSSRLTSSRAIFSQATVITLFLLPDLQYQASARRSSASNPALGWCRIPSPWEIGSPRWSPICRSRAPRTAPRCSGLCPRRWMANGRSRKAGSC